MTLTLTKKRISVAFSILLASALAACTSLYGQTPQRDPAGIYLADPTIFFFQDTYYLYGTVEGNANEGFIAYTSKDLKHWKRATHGNNSAALIPGESYGTANFWAPQVFLLRDSFYMAYVANEHIAIAGSSHPAGPFRQKTLRQLAAPVRQIDPFVFTDEDGKKYLYHVRLDAGNRIFVAEMLDDLSAIKPETLKECIHASSPWENTRQAAWPVTEGPSVIRHKNLYYLFYTANDFRNPDYAVGYAFSSSPFGPWTKYAGNPIISKSIIGVNGTGHGDLLKEKSGELQYVFHTHFSDSVVAPRRTAIIKLRFVPGGGGADKIVADTSGFHYLLNASE